MAQGSEAIIMDLSPPCYALPLLPSGALPTILSRNWVVLLTIMFLGKTRDGSSLFAA